MLMFNINNELEEECPILFVNIGWAALYDGTESITKGSDYLLQNPNDNMELEAFLKNKKGWYSCGIGRGKNISAKNIHVVFVSTDPQDKLKKAVGFYLNAKVIFKDDSNWGVAKAKTAFLFPIGSRPEVLNWPQGRELRRWAYRMGKKGTEHTHLKNFFEKIVEKVVLQQLLDLNDEYNESDEKIGVTEGQSRTSLVNLRKRSASLRDAKVQSMLKKNNGRLICEVPKCGFDFYEKYGELGKGYIHVHHKYPLGKAHKNGQETTLDDLIVVCANCHAMIHLGSECRDINELIP